MDENRNRNSGRADHRDPITGEPGAHPLGTTAGAATGGVAGAAIGMAVGPVGAIVGATIGAVAGGLAGKGVAEAINPTVEDAYWRDAYTREPYYRAGTAYDVYAPAYRTGWEGRGRYSDRTFDEAEAELRADYERMSAGMGSTWDDNRAAARAAWERIDMIRTTSR
jgi:hypothetical protein